MKKLLICALLGLSTSAMAHNHEAADEPQAVQLPASIEQGDSEVVRTEKVEPAASVTRNALQVSCDSEDKIKVNSLVEKDGEQKTSAKELENPEEGATFKSKVASKSFKSNVTVSVDCQ